MLTRKYRRLITWGFFFILVSGMIGPAEAAMKGLAPHVVPPYPAKVGYPTAIGATGDSITRAFNSDPNNPLQDIPANSWSTGTNASVNSQYNRILSANSAINGKAFNDAASGSKMADLNGQVSTVNGQNVDYVTILMGANDACTANEAAMTSVVTFAAEFQTAMTTLSTGSSDARIYVSSIPDVYHLWSIFNNDATATNIWTTYNVCPTMLANATSSAQADVDRRNRVRQRIIDFNTQLQQICATFIHCRFDNNAGFNNAFTTDEVSSIDYFHPSILGQAQIATITYGATFVFTDTSAPVSTATVTPQAGSINVALSASDNVGVAGIEYKFGTSAPWTVYTTTLNINGMATLIYRAVDLNGNIEAAHSLSAVTNTGDDGSGITAGTLSYALTNVNANDLTIYFGLTSGNTVQVTGTLPTVPAVVTIKGGCNATGPLTTLVYTGNQSSGVNGLVLNGGTTVNGLKISGFPGKDLVATSGSATNYVGCVVLG